jgi:hypothetical protein
VNTATEAGSAWPHAAIGKKPLRRWPATVGTLLITPLAMTGCAWLAQRQGTLVLLLGAVLGMLVMVAAWALCGAGPGAFVAVFGFAFMLFVGPAMNDYVIDDRGVRHDAVIGDTSTYYRKHGDGRTCTVVLTDTAKPRAYDVDGIDGCDEEFESGQRVTLVLDPKGWLTPRLSSQVNGVPPYLLWTSAGLLAAMEASVLYGRLRRRQN